MCYVISTIKKFKKITTVSFSFSTKFFTILLYGEI